MKGFMSLSVDILLELRLKKINGSRSTSIKLIFLCISTLSKKFPTTI